MALKTNNWCVGTSPRPFKMVGLLSSSHVCHLPPSSISLVSISKSSTPKSSTPSFQSSSFEAPLSNTLPLSIAPSSISLFFRVLFFRVLPLSNVKMTPRSIRGAKSKLWLCDNQGGEQLITEWIFRHDTQPKGEQSLENPEMPDRASEKRSLSSKFKSR